MKRSIKISLKFVTDKKKKDINNLLYEYRRVVNKYINLLWHTKAKLNKETLALVPKKNTRLSERYKSNALRQALSIMINTKKVAKVKKKYVQMPIFKGYANLDAKFINIDLEPKITEFDLCIKLSTLKKGKRISLPCRRTVVLNKWLRKKGSNLIQGCSLSEKYIILFVDISEPEYQIPIKKDECLGLDIGINKLVSDSNNNHYGTDFKVLRDKILRKEQGSNAYYRALKERDNFIRFTINQLPWFDIKVLGIEDLKNMKSGKKGLNQYKRFRKSLIPWTYRQVTDVIRQKAEENCVLLSQVPAYYTSQTCPSCSMVSKDNRKGEKFQCIRCNYTSDADHVGALNVLDRISILGSLESPRSKDNIDFI